MHGWTAQRVSNMESIWGIITASCIVCCCFCVNACVCVNKQWAVCLCVKDMKRLCPGVCVSVLVRWRWARDGQPLLWMCWGSISRSTALVIPSEEEHRSSVLNPLVRWLSGWSQYCWDEAMSCSQLSSLICLSLPWRSPETQRRHPDYKVQKDKKINNIHGASLGLLEAVLSFMRERTGTVCRVAGCKHRGSEAKLVVSNQNGFQKRTYWRWITSILESKQEWMNRRCALKPKPAPTNVSIGCTKKWHQFERRNISSDNSLCLLLHKCNAVHTLF